MTYRRIAALAAWACLAAGAAGAQNGAGHDIVFYSFRGIFDIYLIGANGENELNVTHDAPKDWYPVPSPDGRHVVFDRGVEQGTHDIFVIDLWDLSTSRVTSFRPASPSIGPFYTYHNSNPFTPDGSGMVFSYLNNLWTVRLDGSGLTQITQSGGDFWASFAPDGSKVVFMSTRDGWSEVYVADRDGGNQTRLTYEQTPGYRYPAFSPDGMRIVFQSMRDGDQEIYVMNTDGTGQTRLTDSPGTDYLPEFLPNGSRIVFGTDRDGNNEIYAMHTDGSSPVNLSNHPAYDGEPNPSPDSRQILFGTARDGGREIYIMSADGSNSRRLTHDGNSFHASFLPGMPTVPALISDLTAQVATQRVRLAWRLQTESAAPPFGVHVLRADAPGDRFERLTVRPLAAAPWMAYEDLGVEPSRNYRYRLEIDSPGGPQVWSQTVEVSTAPASVRTGIRAARQANGSTLEIRYSVAQSGPASLRAYDARGRLVSTLFNATLVAGEHALLWSPAVRGTPLARGVYHLKLVTPAASAATTFVWMAD